MGFRRRVALPALAMAIVVQVIIFGACHLIYMQDDDVDIQQNAILEQFKQSGSAALEALDSITNHHNRNPITVQDHAMLIEDGSIPVFYNLFVANASESSRVMDIVSEQRALLRPEHKPFFIQSMGAVQLQVPDSVVLEHRANGTEMITLHSLWDFCTRNSHVEKVVYLHSKGSSRATQKNEILRKFLTTGALSHECASADSTKCNVCSSRFSPLPHPHTSGNMWLARCDYVRKLIDPFEFEERMHEYTTNCTPSGRPACDGRMRFSAEHWIHSHPSVKPCDLHKDPGFVWGYDNLPENGTVEIELAQAPRFDLIKYVDWGKCVLRGVYLDHRLDEYWGLYKERPDKSWWGWNVLQKDKSWIPPEQKGAKMWRKKELCWSAGSKKETESTVTATPTQAAKKKNAAKRNYDLKNNTNYCPAGSRIPQGPGVGEKENVPDLSPIEIERRSKEIKGGKKRVLVMAAVPRSQRHVLALWSQLECLTIGIDEVVLASPLWSKEIISSIIKLAKAKIPRFSSEVSIEARYFLNDRYDVGLWCDAIASLNIDEFDEFALINDSVFATHSSSDVFDALSVKNVSLTSSGYSYTPKFFLGDDDPVHFWVESIYRGFTRTGLDTFRDHSCVPEDHPFFCPEEKDNKACIVNNFEHDLAIQYPCNKVYGIFPSDAPKSFLEKSRHRMWARNTPYWRALKKELHFPLAKVNQINQVKGKGEKLKECTRYHDHMLETIDFSLAKPRHRRKWEQLDFALRKNATKILGLDEASWKNWASSKFGQTPFDKLTEEQQSFLMQSLDCSPKSWNDDKCGAE